MRFYLRYVSLASLLLCLEACTYSVHLVNFSDQRPYGKTGQSIHAQTEQFVVLGITGNTDYVNQAYEKLMQECHDGRVTAIATKFYTDHGFFSWTNHIDMDASCVN